MASTTQTNNLHLSQFEESDQPGWQADYNNDMEKIDEGAALKADVEEAFSNVETALENKVSKTSPVRYPIPFDSKIEAVPGYECTYYKTQENVVGVTFFCKRKDGSLMMDSEVIATMPIGYRPVSARYRIASGTSTLGARFFCIVLIKPDGTITALRPSTVAAADFRQVSMGDTYISDSTMG